MLSGIEFQAKAENETDQYSIEDYAELLQSFGLKYKKADYYWQVGEISKTQGWILHLSAVISQIHGLLERVIPFLRSERVPFKIAMNATISEDMLGGNLGLALIGKIVCIYPNDDYIAVNLAKKLIELTQSYKGPIVPTDICLGNIVYTRYGSFNPIIKLDADGNEEKYIYDEKAKLIRDPYAIPFQLPKGVIWPFKELTEPILPSPPKLLNHIYKLTDILKADPKGNVFKGLYVKGLFQVKHCAIKQGFSNMNSDTAGRDIQDRLKWQNDLYKELSGVVPMPIIYDLIQEQGSTVLVMEFIQGDSLYNRLNTINPLSNTWADLPLDKSLQLLKYAIEITSIIDRLHRNGYIHRDIVPVNFLIDKRNNIILIDMELAYSLKRNIPTPPFRLGTFGFMSPEQEANQRPTTQEDIYGLGATLLYLFAGILPIKFNTKDTIALSKSLFFFINNKAIATTIASSLHHNPKERPTIPNILQILLTFQQELKSNLMPAKQNRSCNKQNDPAIEQIIISALEGLTKSPIVIKNDLWYSKQLTIQNFTAPENKQYAIFPGISQGICGVLYALARIHRAQISIESCKTGFTKGWDLLEIKYFNNLSEISAGLYKGAAGFALALAESLRSGLLKDNEFNKTKIQNCLTLTTAKIDLADGISGQGLSTLLCEDYLNKGSVQTILDNIVGDLLSKQQKDGSWLETTNAMKRSADKIQNMEHDDTGIIWFLLEYISHYPNVEVEKSIIKGLERILNIKHYMRGFYSMIAAKASYEFGDGGKGLIIMFIKAYEVLLEERYKKIAENALLKYPARLIHGNFTQKNGLAAMGEIYLEACQVFKNEEWKYRADWIANVFVHSFFRAGDGSGHWVMEQNSAPTADFLIGNSGIIHFLARCLKPDKIAYRLLK